MRPPKMTRMDIVDIELPHDLVRLVLGGGHGLAHAGDVRIVPGVVVHQDGPVGHGRDLVPVVPPRHHLGILGEEEEGVSDDLKVDFGTINSFVINNNNKKK